MNLTDEDLAVFKPWLRGCLNTGAVNVVFTKKDGATRSLLCTTNRVLIPPTEIKESSDQPKVRKQNTDSLPVYDLEAKAWRSFRWDSIKEVKVSI